MERSYFGPAFKDAQVHHVMRVGVVTCRPQTKLSDVARMMVGYDVHSIVVAEVGEAQPWGIVDQPRPGPDTRRSRHPDGRRRRDHRPGHHQVERATRGSGEPDGRARDLPPDRGPARPRGPARGHDLRQGSHARFGLRPLLIAGSGRASAGGGLGGADDEVDVIEAFEPEPPGGAGGDVDHSMRGARHARRRGRSRRTAPRRSRRA